MSLKEDGFKSSNIIEQIDAGLKALPEKERAAQIKKTNGIFQLNIQNADKKAAVKEAIWVIDLKNAGTVSKGAAKKADVTITLGDDTFLGLADGKVNAQKAFMTGQLKVKGNVMLATKLDNVLKAAKPKL
ncbi:Fatty acid-binding protein [Vanrija pseudolonga]|uniref:Fatty acid-binding protein n=1 Tax=Vanrija pseudolonga TaxID=143232 RepID=A0AAF1BIG9_9TREE|nr:Fatty acid-binding protein [Vanrija pseudolonga]